MGPKYVDNIIIIFKAFISRVGSGPLDGELTPTEVEQLGYAEFGTVTGRQRRIAPFDVKLAQEAVKINSANQIAITKVDTVFDGAAKIREYDKLPREAKVWLEDIEQKIGAPITLIGTGEEAGDMIDRRPELL